MALPPPPPKEETEDAGGLHTLFCLLGGNAFHPPPQAQALSLLFGKIYHGDSEFLPQTCKP